jgi:hypothetical protein
MIMPRKADRLISDLEGEYLNEAQHIVIYDNGARRERAYFSRGEMEDHLLLALKQIRRLEEIPESLDDVKNEETLKLELVAAAMALRKLATDVRSEDVEDWKKEIWGETLSDRVKTAGMFDSLAGDYDEAARHL